MKHRSRVSVTAVLATALLFAMTIGVAQASQVSKQQQHSSGPLINISYALPTASYSITTVGIQFGISQGYFRKQGFNVTVIPTSNPIQALLSGNVQIAQTGADTASIAIAAGSPIKMIDTPMIKQPGVVIARAPISTLAQLEGQTYGISSPGSSTQVDITAEMNAAHLNPSSLQFVAVGAPAARITALIAGKIQATDATILILEPALAGIKDHTLNVVTKDATSLPNLPLSVDIAETSYIEAHPKLLQRFMYAEFEGYAWAQTHPKGAALDALPDIPGTGAQLMQNGMAHLSAIHAYGIGGITIAEMNRIENELTRLGSIKAPLPVAEAADVTISQKVAKMILGKLTPQQQASLLGT